MTHIRVGPKIEQGWRPTEDLVTAACPGCEYVANLNLPAEGLSLAMTHVTRDGRRSVQGVARRFEFKIGRAHV